MAEKVPGGQEQMNEAPRGRSLLDGSVTVDRLPKGEQSMAMGKADIRALRTCKYKTTKGDFLGRHSGKHI